MKISRIHVLLALLGILLGIAGISQWSRHQDEQRRAEIARQIAALAWKPPARLEPIETNKDRIFQGWLLEMPYPRPVSEWRTNEKSFYRKLLMQQRFEVLVVPFQVQDDAFDQASRSFMTAELSHAISLCGKKSMPDPYLVERSLGDGERRIAKEEVYALADKTGAKRIVWGYVGHDKEKNTMTLTLKIQDRRSDGSLNQGTPVVTHNYEQTPFSDENPAIEIYQSRLPGMLKDMGLDPAGLSGAMREGVGDTSDLPPFPKDLVADDSAPERVALGYQLLAALTPRNAERTKGRFAEKSLMAALDVSPASRRYRLLKARASMLLGMRPYALKILKDPATPEEKELVAALNGNLAEMKGLETQLTSGPDKLLALLDEVGIAVDYEVITQSQAQERVRNLSLPGKVWPFLAARATADGFLWAQQDNIYLKSLLDLEFPNGGLTAENLVREGRVARDPATARTKMDVSVVEHVRSVLERDLEKAPAQEKSEVFRHDYLDLIEALGTDNLMRQAHFLTTAQGRPEAAFRFLNSIESVYKDYPGFSLARARAEAGMARVSSGAEKEGLLKRAYADAINAMYWEQGQTRISSDAFDFARELGRADYGYFENLYIHDWPFHSYYSTWTIAGSSEYRIPHAVDALANSTSDFSPAQDLAFWYRQMGEAQVDSLAKDLTGRFDGSPQYLRFLAERSLNRSDLKTAENYFRKSISSQPGYWPSYPQLGQLFLQSEETAGAFKLFLSYPGFRKDSTENRVAIANNAEEAAGLFYWAGNFPEAAALYKISASQHTGAETELISEERLCLMRSDISCAIGHALERIQDYESHYGYVDYLTMLHATGQADEAWGLSDALANQNRKGSVWDSALVGMRKSGASEEKIIAWARKMQASGSADDAENPAAFLLRAGLMDRLPSTRLVSTISDLELPVWQLDWPQAKYVVREKADPNVPLLGPNLQGMPWATLPVDLSHETHKARVKSDRVYFVEAYREMKLKNYAASLALFKEAAQLFDMSSQETRYMAPYFVFAAQKSGDDSAVEKLLSRFSMQQQEFHYYLTRAVHEGLNGKAEQSLAMAHKALAFGPGWDEGGGLSSDYEYAEMMEWLFKATKNEKYRSEALDWVKKCRTMKPWTSWAYAIEASLQTDSTSRLNAIAMTLYLDPGSERISLMSKRDLADARQSGKGNPFKGTKKAVPPQGMGT